MNYVIKIALFAVFLGVIYYITDKVVAMAIANLHLENLGNKVLYILQSFKVITALNVLIGAKISAYLVQRVIRYWEAG